MHCMFVVISIKIIFIEINYMAGIINAFSIANISITNPMLKMRT